MKRISVQLMAIVILGFCAYGFGSKLIEFIRLVQSDDPAARDGIFAVSPLANYLFASAGFLCLLLWAAAHGMFHNIERPKETMLEINEKLDSQATDLHFCDSVMQSSGKGT